jgi:mono/diheme cytochrome c family protein
MKKTKLAAIVVIIIGLLALAPMLARADDTSKAEQRRLFREGARLWPVYCSQCHQARPGGQFSAVQWNSIMMHMRTQSEMPAKDARAILEYLRAAR